jgi:hypothetical protein
LTHYGFSLQFTHVFLNVRNGFPTDFLNWEVPLEP